MGSLRERLELLKSNAQREEAARQKAIQEQSRRMVQAENEMKAMEIKRAEELRTQYVVPVRRNVEDMLFDLGRAFWRRPGMESHFVQRVRNSELSNILLAKWEVGVYQTWGGEEITGLGIDIERAKKKGRIKKVDTFGIARAHFGLSETLQNGQPVFSVHTKVGQMIFPIEEIEDVLFNAYSKGPYINDNPFNIDKTP